ncbi:AbrB family transcriptional regulator [soil metagenome]
MISLFLSLAAGAAGGALFWFFGLPVPWLMGSIIGAALAMAAGLTIRISQHLQSAALIVLGIQIGASVTPETLAGVTHWPLSMVLLAVTVTAVTAICYQYYLRFTGWDRATALFASLPGALSLVLVLAQENKADMRRVTVAQCIRLIFLVAAIPPIYAMVSTPAAYLPLGQGSLRDIAIVMAASTAAAFVFLRLRLPGGLFVGATFMSAGLYLTGIAHGAMPPGFLIAANVIFGVALAGRFQSFTLAELGASLREGFSGFLIALAISSVGAILASVTGNLSFVLTLLAFAPGGLDVMTIMAMSLGLDPAYVGAHQIARFLVMSMVMPAFAAWFFARHPPNAE